jgi:hypothetical protein
MAIPSFEKKPSKAELRRFSKDNPEWAEKRRQKAANLLEFRKTVQELEKTDPEAAEAYRKSYLPPEKSLEQFYSQVEEEYQELPFSEAEIRELFTTEHLSRLSLDEYVKLLRHVPPRFITHVTRQGIRDNISHHYGGYGEFHRGFEGILESGFIRSILEQKLLDGVTKETVQTILKEELHIPEEYPTRLQAYERIDDFLNRSPVVHHSSEFADKKAVHTALDMVGNTYYGGETGNEIFFIYPAAYIAANYRMGTQLMNIPERFTPDSTYRTSQFNDFWLMSKEKKSGDLPIDASIVFLPARAEVDPETGSRYAVGPDGKPEKNVEEVKKIIAMFSSAEMRELWPKLENDFQSILEIRSAVERLLEDAAQFESENQSYDAENRRNSAEKKKLLLDQEMIKLDPLFDLINKYHISDPRFLKAVTSTDFLDNQALNYFFRESQKPAPFSDQYGSEENLVHLNLVYKLAEKTISSKDYWEAYFARTGRRPSKVIFYEQDSPNEAMRVFRERAGLVEEGLHQQIDLKEMFVENDIGQEGIHDQLQNERELFLRFAEELLDDLYPKEAAAGRESDPAIDAYSGSMEETLQSPSYAWLKKFLQPIDKEPSVGDPAPEPKKEIKSTSDEDWLDKFLKPLP